MKLFYLAAVGCTLLATAAVASDKGRPSIDPAVMEKVRVCAAAKGVELPAPPQGRSSSSTPPPRPTETERKVLDACFHENGVNPPQPPSGRPRG